VESFPWKEVGLKEFLMITTNSKRNILRSAQSRCTQFGVKSSCVFGAATATAATPKLLQQPFGSQAYMCQSPYCAVDKSLLMLWARSLNITGHKSAQ
jgi:hypothetical protein